MRPSSSSTPSARAPERGVGRLALDLGHVDLGDLVARMREPVRELAVVREQERAGRVGVETSDRHDARLVRDELDDGRAAAGIARRGDDTGGLVQQQVGKPLLRDGPPVDLDAVAARDERVQLARRTVDAHAARLDQLVCLAPRSDAGPGEVRVQAHGCASFVAITSPMGAGILVMLAAGRRLGYLAPGRRGQGLATGQGRAQ